MTSDKETADRLEQLGQADGPEVDGAYADRLEADLRMAMVARMGATRRPIWQPVLAAAALFVVVIVGAVILGLTDRGSTELVMSTASDTELVLSDGSTGQGQAGLRLEDGTRVVVGPEGQAVVGGVVLFAGSEAMVVDGRLQLIKGPTSLGATTTTPTTSPSTVRPSTTSVATGADSSTTTSTRPSSTTSSEGDRTTAPPTRPSAPPATDATTTTGIAELSLDLTIEAVGDGRLRLWWTAVGGTDVSGWRVEVVSRQRFQTVAVLRDGTARTVTVERPETTVGYRVVALGEGGLVLAASETVEAP